MLFSGNWWESLWIWDGEKARHPTSQDDYMNNEKNRFLFKAHISKNTWVSTVLLETDHNMINSGGPIIFETLAYHEDDEFDQVRYTSYDKAKDGHLTVLYDLCKYILEGIE